VKHRTLQDALEPEGRLNVHVLLAIVLFESRCRFGNELHEITPKLSDVCAAGLQNLEDLRRVEQREQQVLDRDELVLSLPSLLESLVKTIFEFAR
jgi:hypothetical protein